MTDLNMSDRSAYSIDDRLPRPRVAGALVSAVVTMLANAQLARAARRHRSRGSPPVPSFLRHDLGLPPAEEQWWRAMDRW
jgi:hypothetical protein